MSRKAVQAIVGVGMVLFGGLYGVYAIPAPRLDSLVNYPNPFDSRRSATTIAYSLPDDSAVTVRLMDLLGGAVREWNFAAGEPGARRGANRLAWDGTDERGEKVVAGGYLCQVVAEREDGSVQGFRKIGVLR